MDVTSWTIIFVLFNWPPNGLCLNFNVGNDDFICRAVLKRDPWTRTTVLKKTDFKCWIKSNIGQTRERQCVLTILNTTRNYVYVHITSRNCDIPRAKYSVSKLRCILPNKEERQPLNGTSTKNSSKHIVYFINSAELIRKEILGSRRANAGALRWRTRTKHLNVFICSKWNGSSGWEKRDESLHSKDRVIGKTFVRKRRNIFENSTSSSTAFSTYSRNTIISRQDTPPLTTTSVQSPTVSAQSGTKVWDLCPQSVVVNRTTVTPTAVVTRHAGSLVATSTFLTHFSATPTLRNNTPVAEINILCSASRLNATSTLAHFENRSQNATYVYKKDVVSVIYTTRGSTFTTICATSIQEALSTQNYVPTSNISTQNDSTKHTKLYVGLIAGGGVVLSIMVCTAMFLLGRRYRRIKALRRKAKQISYFNRFDCSSAWDEPDRFGGSKLSVFTLKNSKFDIDWESTHDSK